MLKGAGGSIAVNFIEISLADQRYATADRPQSGIFS